MTLTSQDFLTVERDSWIDQATAECFGLRRVDSFEGAELVGRKDREDYAGIVFPIYWPGTVKFREQFLRRDHPPIENGKPKRKYMAPPGRSNMLLFGPSESVEALADTKRLIVLGEGLKKLLAAYRLARHDTDTPRFLACAILGVWNWKGKVGKTTDATGTRVDEKGVIPDFDRVTWTGRNVVVIFDSDFATNEKVARARRDLMAELKKRGARAVALDLPSLDGLEKTGFDDLLAQCGPEHALGLIQEALRGQGTTPITSRLSEGDEATLQRLAALSPVEYDRVRKEEAEKLKIRQETLDREVTTRRPRTEKGTGSGQTLTFPEVEVWPEPVDGAELLTAMVAMIRRHVSLLSHAAEAVALWVMWSSLIDRFDIAPRLAVLSPEKRCGKTTLLTLLFHLTLRPLLVSGITPSAIFRTIEVAKPTLLIDEADTFTEGNEELRGILNSGHTRASATIIRTVGENFEPRAFSTWCPMVLAAIGSLPGTVEDRSIVIPMQRKAPGEQVASFPRSGKKATALRSELATLPRKAKRWTEDNGPALAEQDPSMPPGLHDRAADNWRPLLAIADLIGGDWPKRSRQSATALSGGILVESESIKVQLLHDIRALFSKDGRDRIGSQILCDELAQLEERPWGDWKKGKPITQAQLARLLRPFGVASRDLKRPPNVVFKGYVIEDLNRCFERYLPLPCPDTPVSNRYAATSHSQSDETSLLQSATEGVGSVSENARIPAPVAKSSAVADQNQEIEAGEAISLVD